MFNTIEILIPEYAEKLFNICLLLYPEEYRKQFGQEMRFVFCEMYHEELENNGKVGFTFWLRQISDITKSIIEQHIHLIGKKGMKKYFQQTLHINKYNVIGFILVLPIITIVMIDIIARIVQGDLVHYNRTVYAFLSHSPLYWHPVLATWVILFPLAAALVNIVPLVKTQKNKNFSYIIKRNIFSILIILLGLGFLAMIKLHDFVPCMVHGIFNHWSVGLPKMIAVCRRA